MGHNFDLLLYFWLTGQQWRNKRKLPSIHPLNGMWHFHVHHLQAFFILKSSCNFVYEHHRSWAEAAGRCHQCVQSGDFLVQNGRGIQVPGISCLNVKVSLSGMFCTIRRKIKNLKRSTVIPLCATAYKSLLPKQVFFLCSNKRSCNICKNPNLLFLQNYYSVFWSLSQFKQLILNSRAIQ